MLRTTKILKIVAKHVYNSIPRGQSSLNYISMYSCIYQQISSKHSFRKHIGIIQQNRTHPNYHRTTRVSVLDKSQKKIFFLKTPLFIQSLPTTKYKYIPKPLTHTIFPQPTNPTTTKLDSPQNENESSLDGPVFNTRQGYVEFPGTLIG